MLNEFVIATLDNKHACDDKIRFSAFSHLTVSEFKKKKKKSKIKQTKTANFQVDNSDSAFW